MRFNLVLRQAVTATQVVSRAARVPEPRAALTTPADFVNAIGRNATKKLSGPLSGWSQWEDMWAANGETLKTAGVPVKDRRYFLWCLEKFRNGGDPKEFAIPQKPKKKFRGWGPKVQNGKRIHLICLLKNATFTSHDPYFLRPMTPSPSSSPSPKPSYLPNHIKHGDKVLIRLPSGDCRHVQINDSIRNINLGKFGSFVQNQLIGHPFGLSYDIIKGEQIQVRPPEGLADVEDTSATNELINDGNAVQPLTFEEIEVLKKTPGVHSSDIIKLQISQNANYDLKTEYSKDKYKKRKEAKFRQGFSVLEPTMFNICEFWFNKDPVRIRGIRADTLAQMMSFGNIHPGSRVLAVDDTGGMIVAAVLERLGGEGRLMTITDADSPPTYHIIDHLNLDADETAKTLSFVNWAEVDEDYVPVEGFEPEKFTSNSQRNRHDKRQKRAEEMRLKREELWAGEWDALLVSSEYDPFSVVSKLQPYLAGSANIVVHSPFVQVLTEAHQKMRSVPCYLGPSVTEAWLRQYQVLPGRTHPMMNMSGSGGYLLTAIKIYDDATANSSLVARNAQRKAARANKSAAAAAAAAAGTSTPTVSSSTDMELVEQQLHEAIEET